MPEYDAILIPGGGVRQGGELPLWTRRRLHRAVQRQAGEYLITLSAGTVHKPTLLDDYGFPIYESAAAARYLMEQGIDGRQVLMETVSYDTIGNAYFSRVIHVAPLGLQKLLIITSEFHMLRTEAIFRWVYGLDAPRGGYDLCFESVSDEGIDKESVLSRKKREQESLERLLTFKDKITTLRQFHNWLFSDHDIYSASLQPKRTAGSILGTY